MLKRFFAICTILLFGWFSASIVFAGSKINMQEGLWEITSEVKMPGMSLPPTTHTQCIKKDDLVPQKTQPGQECKITDVKISGNTVTYKMRCSGQGGDMTGTGEITYNGDRFAGTMKMNMPGQNMTITTHMKGRRIGECQ
jgi:hypothetical protein